MGGKTESVLKPLPAEKLCNKWGEGNPINGDGPLGNQNKERMHYIGSDREELVKTVQMMLKTLGYDLGTSGPDGNGIDGYFGDTTEEAMIDFQMKNKDWDGELLKEEGLVGPRTSDALNRAMVGKLYKNNRKNYKWYDHYQTPEKLVDGKPYLTVTSEFFTKGLLIQPGKSQKGKVFLADQISMVQKPFELTLEMGEDKPWTKEDYLVILDSQDKVAFQSCLGDGKLIGSRRLFAFNNCIKNERYRGELRFRHRVFVLFEHMIL